MSSKRTGYTVPRTVDFVRVTALERRPPDSGKLEKMPIDPGKCALNFTVCFSSE
jgi:hypothetical protein